jgi:hypothetical protein
VGGLALSAGLVACSHTLAEEDCEAVRMRLEAAWLSDANAAATEADNEQVRRFVKDESARIGQDWMARCRQRIGTEIDDRELRCLRRVEHVDDVDRCASK